MPLLLVPITLGWRWRAIRRPQVASLAVTVAAAAVVIAPWSLYNLARLHEPMLTSTSFGSAMAQGNCDPVYYGKELGYYDFVCQRMTARAAALRGVKDPLGDSALRSQALRYLRGHLGRFPIVLLARQGRTWSFYKPFATFETEYQFPQKPWWPQGAALFSYWLLLPFAAFGGVVLRRKARRAPPAPRAVRDGGRRGHDDLR